MLRDAEADNSVDLDELEAVLATAFPGPWIAGRAHESVVAPEAGDPNDINADADTFRHYGGALVCESAWKSSRAIIALHNAAPKLIAELRRLRAQAETNAA